MEEWKDIPGWEGYYQVSDSGNIKSVRRVVPGRWGQTTVPERILRPYTDKDGYLRVILNRDGKSFGYGVHRLVAQAFIGVAPDGFDVHHEDENKSNNQLSNLSYVPKSTHNFSHRADGLSSLRGQRHWKNKLTEQQVREIRQWLATGQSQRSIARMYGVTSQLIGQIDRGQAWSWLESSA